MSIIVVRNRFAPVFEGEPYTKTISQDLDSGSEVITVTSSDRDERVSKNIGLLLCYSSSLYMDKFFTGSFQATEV